MNWYSWTSEEAFNAWHMHVTQLMGLPRVGVNARTGKPEPEKQATTGYTSVTMIAEGDWRAPVDLDDMPRNEDGLVDPAVLDTLGTLSEAPPAPDDIV